MHERCLSCVQQGIDRLTLIFSQLVIASLAVSTITTLEVAVKWPESVVYVSALFFLVAVVRCAFLHSLACRVRQSVSCACRASADVLLLPRLP